jgi:Carboxypeptidase regulatory-like domain
MTAFRFVFLVCLCAVAASGPIAAQSEPSGSFAIDGRVIDVMTGESLPGAEVSVNEGYARTATDRDGRFRIVSLSPGMVTVKITYLGRPDWTRAMTAEPGAIVHLGDLAVGDIEENVLVNRLADSGRRGACVEPAEGSAEHSERCVRRSDRIVSRSQRRGNDTACSRHFDFEGSGHQLRALGSHRIGKRGQTPVIGCAGVRPR